jgi:hypothetical protein
MMSSSGMGKYYKKCSNGKGRHCRESRDIELGCI